MTKTSYACDKCKASIPDSTGRFQVRVIPDGRLPHAAAAQLPKKTDLCAHCKDALVAFLVPVKG